MKGSKWLSSEEFASFWDTSTKLVETRQDCLDYVLERASLSKINREKFAWYGVYKIIRFVEDFHRFPDRKEMDRLLDPSEILEHKLDQFDFWSNRDTLISKSVHRLSRGPEDP